MADDQINQIRREATRAIDAVQNDRDLTPEAKERWVAKIRSEAQQRFWLLHEHF